MQWKLRDLKLDLVRRKVSTYGLSILAPGLFGTSVITELYLGMNNIVSAGAVHVAEIVTHNTSLHTLSLMSTSLGDGIIDIATALQENATLTKLNLSGAFDTDFFADSNSDDFPGDVGATALANALNINRTLRSLCLAGNKIGARGATELAFALQVCSMR